MGPVQGYQLSGGSKCLDTRQLSRNMGIGTMVLMLLVAPLVAGCATGGHAPAPQDGAGAAQEAVSVSRAYFDAIAKSDLAAAGKLFAQRSSIFETGGVEGDWAHYEAHHLKPELDAIASFTFDLGDHTVSTSVDGTMAVVTWQIGYHIELADGRHIDSRGTVTFVVVRQGPERQARIRHLHWSSRRKKPKAH